MLRFITLTLFTLFLLTASAGSCEEMSKDFFLEKMNGLTGENPTDVLERSEVVQELGVNISREYPNQNILECLTSGLEAAIETKKSDSM